MSCKIKVAFNNMRACVNRSMQDTDFVVAGKKFGVVKTMNVGYDAFVYILPIYSENTKLGPSTLSIGV